MCANNLLATTFSTKTKGSNQGFLSTGHPEPTGLMSGSGLAGKSSAVRTGTQISLQLRRLSVEPLSRSSPIHTRHLAVPADEDTPSSGKASVFCVPVYVSHGSSDSYIKAGVPRSSSYETNPMTSKEQLACAKVP